MNDRTLLRRPRRPQAFTALSYLAAPLTSMGRETKAVLSNPRALFGGLAGAALICAALAAAFTARPAEAHDAGPEVEFSPGVLTPLGVVYPDQVQVITTDLHTVEDTPPEAVTKDDTPTPEKVDPPEPVEDPPQPQPTPTPDPPKDSTPADTNTESNNPYPDPPTVDQNAGDPFGTSNGWGDMVKDGAPWATSVMSALNRMSVPAWAAQVQAGTYTFRLQVCRDGRIAKVFTKGSSGDASLDATIRKELTRTKLPSMPAKLAAQMPGSCATLKYNFSWSRSRVR